MEQSLMNSDLIDWRKVIENTVRLQHNVKMI